MALKPSTFALAAAELFERLESKYSVGQQIEFADSDLLELHGLFGETLKHALDIVDRNKVRIYRDRTNEIQLIEIPSHQSIVYRLFPTVNYCSCKAFHRKVVIERQKFGCKHILAARLAIILGKITEEVVADDVLKLLTQSID